MRKGVLYIVYGSIFLILAFFLATSIAMYFYPGGTILDRSAEGYQLTQNFFSDLGRRHAWNGTQNTVSNYLFDYGMYGAGFGLLTFFTALPFVFTRMHARRLAIAASVFGWLAAIAYFGIALNPLDYNYRIHTLFVRAGFISFLIMGVLYVLAIRREPTYPKRYAYAFLLFDAILFVQICLMIFGPRSWSSPAALSMQVIAQKIVVYAQLGCLLYQCFGVVQYLTHQQNLPDGLPES